MSEVAVERKSRLRRLVGAFGGIAGLAAVISVVFTLMPTLKPCLGDDRASFTGAPVFPRVNFREHLVRTGVRREKAAQEPNLLGAEVRFSYQINDLRGQRLPVTSTLVAIERDGTLGPVVYGQDRAPATIIEPHDCSESGGTDLFVRIPNPRTRYRIVLELYRDERMNDRLDLTQTAVFRG